jgi:hypothetical protein
MPSDALGPRRRRPGYRTAIDWIVKNDCEWLKTRELVISATGAMAADLFGVPREKVVRDLVKAHKRIWGR